MSDRFKLSIVEMGSAYAALVYDLEEKKIVNELTDYADELINHLRLKRLSVQQEIGYLRVFWSFLASTDMNIEAVSDEAIKAFRAYALKKALASRSHREGRPDASSATVNAKLVRIYDWLMWLQEMGRFPANTIGYRNAAVRSALRGSSLSREARGNKELRALDKYPLLLTDRTRNTKHHIQAFIPSEDTVDALHAHFMNGGQSSHLRHRNALIVDVAAYTGFRRNSIQSLHVNQFIGSEFTATDRDTVIIRPSRQKFDYGDTFEIPALLHHHICNFVQTYRRELIQAKGVDQRVSEGAVFISERTCEPLDDRSITSLVSKALRACGAPKGAAVHSFRRKFLVEAMADEYADRRQLGLDTSEDAVTQSVARKAGQKNPKSLRPYVAGDAASLLVRNKAERLRKEQTLQQENARLRDEIQHLRSKLREADRS